MHLPDLLFELLNVLSIGIEFRRNLQFFEQI